VDNIYLIIVLIVITFFFLWGVLKMATQNLSQVEDFSELGQDFRFKYNDKIFSIPPIPPMTAKKLVRSGREFSVRSAEKDKRIREFEAENELLPDNQKKPLPIDLLDEAENFFDFQVNFILDSNIIEINENNEKIGSITKENIEKGWSTQLVMRIFRRINEIISVEQEKKS